jgi:hypothetical protein
MRQQTLGAQASFEKYARKSRRELFLEEMEQVVPWAKVEGVREKSEQNRTDQLIATRTGLSTPSSLLRRIALQCSLIASSAGSPLSNLLNQARSSRL